MTTPQAGFTLLEVLMSVAIISLLMGIAAPVYISFQNRNALDTTTQTVVESIRRAASYARSGKGDANWGVRVQVGSLVVYEGASYAARDTTADETVSLNGAITPSGTTEINFNELTGTPTATASLVMTSGVNNETDTITVNAEGMVSY